MDRANRFPAGDRSTGWFLKTFMLLLGVGLAALCLFVSAGAGAGGANRLSVIGIGLLVGVAGFAAGGLAGFLFGVPRLLPGTRRSADDPVIVGNANLELLSDWLTKMLVGVGLVEVHGLNGMLVAFRDQIDRVAAGFVPGAGIVACLILIGAAIAGFLTAYLKARTDLMHAFREPLDMVRTALGEASRRMVTDAARDRLDRPSAEPGPAVREAAARLVQSVPPSDDPALHRLVGLAHAAQGNFAAAGDALRRAIRLCGGRADPLLHALAARALTLAGEVGAARRLASGLLPPGPLAQADIEQALAAMFAQLHSAGGFDRVIAIGRRLAEDDGARMSGRLWLYLTRAYGRRHAALVQTGADAGDAGVVRDEALAALRQALLLDPDHAPAMLRPLWEPAAPGTPPGQNDLASLSGDVDFAALLAPGTAPGITAG